MSLVKSQWWTVGIVACGLAGAMGITGAVAQIAAHTPRSGKRAERHQLHSYFRSYENAKRSNTPFVTPEELVPHEGQFELTLTRNRFKSRHSGDVIAGIDGPIPETFELLCYNGKRVGPTIRVKRGSKFKIHVKNALHGELDPGTDPMDTKTAENVHGFCTTNLHTHGLHVSPSGNADNIFRQIEAGEEFTFEYEIGPKHPSGTFWYHPHKHGSTAYQLSNGVSGALIVEGKPGDDIADLEDIKEIQDAQQKILVLQAYSFGTFLDPVESITVGFIDGQTIYNANEKLLSTCDLIRPDQATLKRGGWTALAVNGIFNPKFEMAPGELQRWRVVHAGWDIRRQFAWYKDDGKGNLIPTKDVQFWEIALDGLATGRLDSLTTDDPLNTSNPWQVAPGQRSDVLVQAPDLKAGTVATYYLMIPGAPPTPPSTTPSPPTHVAKLVVQGTPNRMPLPPVAELAKCVPFKAVEKGELVPGTIPDPTNDSLSLFSSDATGMYTLNFQTFHTLAPIPIPLKLGTAQEWTLKVDINSDSGHPFHIHVNPFQVVSGWDDKNQSIPIPENTWRDTLYIDIGYRYKIRSRYADDIEGLSVLHCHILDHEDQGMMRTINLSRDPAPAAAAATAGDLKRVATLAPEMKLRDFRGKPRTLAEFKGRKVALVFFRGNQCFHCAEQLKGLVLDTRVSLGRDVEVVAVSSRPITDPPQVLKALGVTDSDRFHLLIDETHDAFRAFGCLAAEPQHGLFLIDEAGTIRWRYVGETPFADSKVVVERIRDLTALPQNRSPGSDPGTSPSLEAGQR